MKSHTDLEQSKKLAEILPLESADMYYRDNGIDVKLIWEHNTHKVKYPCWSLVALLELMPKHIKQNDGRTYKFHIFNDDGIVIQRWGCSYCAEDFHNRAEYLSDPHLKYPTNVYSDKYKDPVDACYEMILKIKEKGFFKFKS